MRMSVAPLWSAPAPLPRCQPRGADRRSSKPSHGRPAPDLPQLIVSENIKLHDTTSELQAVMLDQCSRDVLLQAFRGGLPQHDRDRALPRHYAPN